MKLNHYIDEGDVITNTAGEEFLVTGYDEQRQMVRFFARGRDIKPMFARPLWQLNAEGFQFAPNRLTVHAYVQNGGR